MAGIAINSDCVFQPYLWTAIMKMMVCHFVCWSLCRYHGISNQKAAYALYVNNGSPMMTIKWIIETGLKVCPRFLAHCQLQFCVLAKTSLYRISLISRYLSFSFFLIIFYYYNFSIFPWYIFFLISLF